MKDLTGKKLLVLGGGTASINVVRFAHDMGLKVYVVDDRETGEAKEMADEKAVISTVDYDALAAYIKENGIDGVMTGASEFNIVNTMKLCKQIAKPFYATEEQWNICQNKRRFKDLCIKTGVPCVKDFDPNADPKSFDYPVIVKPVDACSARGITVCHTPEEFLNAKEKALGYSPSKTILVEQYVINGGTTLSVKYIARDGELYLEAVGDRYVLDADSGKALITAAAFYPSKHTDYYIEHLDEKVKNMFKSIGLRNGCLFMEALKTDTDIVFYEMGLRISGGMTYNITEVTNKVNELKMLISYATTGSMCEDEDIRRINPHLNGYVTASLAVPLRTGTIATIFGLDEIRKIPQVLLITQYYYEGDVIEPRHIGTLDQLLARVTVIADNKEQLTDIINKMLTTLSVKDEQGNEMFITSKLEEIYSDYIS